MTPLDAKAKARARLTRAVVVMGLALVLLAASGCDGGSDEPGQTAPTSSPTLPSVTASPSPTMPTGLETYSPEQQALYRDAVVALNRYIHVVDAVNGRGVADKKADRRIRAVAGPAQFPTVWQRLLGFSTNGFHTAGRTLLSGVTPKRIATTPDGSASVNVRACTDPTGVRVLRADDSEVAVKGLKPVMVEYTIERFPDQPWLVNGVKGAKPEPPC